MFGGDEVGAIVLDMGSHSTRVGYAGEDTPKAILPSQVGPGGYVGETKLARAVSNVELTPVMQHGVITDWNAAETLISHALHNVLQADPTEGPLLFSEPVFNSRSARETLAELAFETFGAPAFFVAKDAVLSAYAAGKPSGVVFSSGGQVSVASVVSDGYVLQNTIVRNHAVAGNSLNLGILNLLEENGINVVPRHGFSVSQDGNVVYNQPEGMTHSFDSFVRARIVDDLKASLCALSPSSTFDIAGVAPTPYELPDRTLFEWQYQRFMIPEVMFRPKWLYELQFKDGSSSSSSSSSSATSGVVDMDIQSSTTSTTSSTTTPATSSSSSSSSSFVAPPPLATAGVVRSQEWMAKPGIKYNTVDPIPVDIGSRDDSLGVHEMIFKAGTLADIDLRRDIFSSVILAGGNTLFPNFADRVKADLAALLPSTYKLKVTAFNSKNERRFAPWIGGSILGSLGSMHSLWISKEEYQEHGASLVGKKCP